MSQRPQAVGGAAILLRAMREEALHFLALVQSSLDAQGDIGPAEAVVWACTAAMFGAAVGEAKRLFRERGDQGDAEVQRLVDTANAIEAGLSHRLYLVWRVHFVDGRALTEYARAAGVHESVARNDFRDLVRVLVTMMPRAATEMADVGGQTVPDTAPSPKAVVRLVPRPGAHQLANRGQER